jgi:hypothetical protein
MVLEARNRICEWEIKLKYFGWNLSCKLRMDGDLKWDQNRWRFEMRWKF